MKWFRLVMMSATLALFCACESPTVPRFPQDEDEPEDEDPDPPPTQGLILLESGVYWV